ncbi:TlpA disulfide reductase family protein [Bacillus sp. FJAT-49736]|uniref:peroxiredoxin family protein n=1 Tax=Bacillus sp. FJAT-49736 TaxID=2833582 RepID=UPI0032D59E1F
MKKNLLTFAILIIAVLIIVINIWRPSFLNDLTNKKTAMAETSNTKGLSSNSKSVQEGAEAPDFVLSTLDGKTAKLSDYRGQKIILNFWASWCPPCKAEMPYMQKFYEKNKSKNITIVSVNLTSMDRGTSLVQSFISKNNITFPVLLDKNGDIGKTYQAVAIPTSYIIDQNGIIRKKIIGPMDEAMMEDLTNNI